MGTIKIEKVDVKPSCATCKFIAEDWDELGKISCTKGAPVQDNIAYVTDLYHIVCEHYEEM